MVYIMTYKKNINSSNLAGFVEKSLNKRAIERKVCTLEIDDIKRESIGSDVVVIDFDSGYRPHDLDSSWAFKVIVELRCGHPRYRGQIAVVSLEALAHLCKLQGGETLGSPGVHFFRMPDGIENLLKLTVDNKRLSREEWQSAVSYLQDVELLDQLDIIEHRLGGLFAVAESSAERFKDFEHRNDIGADHIVAEADLLPLREYSTKIRERFNFFKDFHWKAIERLDELLAEENGEWSPCNVKRSQGLKLSNSLEKAMKSAEEMAELASHEQPPQLSSLLESSAVFLNERYRIDRALTAAEGTLERVVDG